MIAMAKRLHRANSKTGKRLSLRKIATALAKTGYVNVNGRERQGHDRGADAREAHGVPPAVEIMQPSWCRPECEHGNLQRISVFGLIGLAIMTSDN